METNLTVEEIQKLKSKLSSLNQTLSNKQFLLEQKKKELDELTQELFSAYQVDSIDALSNKLISLRDETNKGVQELSSLLGGLDGK